MAATYIVVTNLTQNKLSFTGDYGKPSGSVGAVGSASATANINVKDLLGNVLLCTTLISWLGSSKVTITRGGVAVTAAQLLAYEQGADMDRVDYDADDNLIVDAAEEVEVGSFTSVAAAASPYTVLSTDQWLLVNTSAGAVHLDLPTAVGISGKTYVIVDANGTSATNPITLDGSGAQTIDGSATVDINSPRAVMEIVSNGANWISRSAQVRRNAPETFTSVAFAASPYTVLAADSVLAVTTAGGAVTLNLPATAGTKGKVYTVVDVGGVAGTSAITIAANGAERIDGDLASVAIRVNYGVIELTSTGAGWISKSAQERRSDFSTRTSVNFAASPFTVTKDHVVLSCDSTAGAITLNLPAAAGLSGKRLCVVDATGLSPVNAISIAPNGGDFIDGVNAAIPLNVRYGALELVSNGATGWVSTTMQSRENASETQTAVDFAASPFAVSLAHSVILCDTAGGVVHLDLPTATGNKGKKYTIVDAGGLAATNAIEIDPNGGELIDGVVLEVINVNRGVMEITCNGTGWVSSTKAERENAPQTQSTVNFAASPFAVTTAFSVFLVDSTAGVVHFDLPTAVGNKGKKFLFIDSVGLASRNAIELHANGAELIDGIGTLSIEGWRDSVEIVSTGAGWLSNIAATRVNEPYYQHAVVFADSPHALTTANSVVLCDTVGGGIELDLPSAVGLKGKKFLIMDSSGSAAVNAITIDPDGVETIDGLHPFVLEGFHAAIELVSDGTNWHSTNLPDALNSPSVQHGVVFADSPHALTNEHSVLVADTTGGVVRFDLPTAVGCKGKTYTIVDGVGNAAVNNITIFPNGAETIDGQASITMNAARAITKVTSTGAGWFTEQAQTRANTANTFTTFFEQAVAATVAAQHSFYASAAGRITGVAARTATAAAAGESMTIDVLINGASCLTAAIVLDAPDGTNVVQGAINAAADDFVVGDRITYAYTYVAGGGPTPMTFVTTQIWAVIN